MSISPRISSRLWIGILVLAVGFLTWTNHGRMRRVEYVSGLAMPQKVISTGSSIADATGRRELIVPERNENSFQWMAQTQQMFARGEARVRHVDYDNAPVGREVNAASPYRWWLGLVAWLDHAVSGRSLGLSVERAALWADPVLHGLLVIGGTIFVAWQFGGFAAALLAIGLVTAFPFAAGFLPGVPDQRGLASGCALASVLFLLAGVNGRRAGVGTHRWFVLAGIIGGLGGWISVSTQVPVVAGIFIGALAAAWIARCHAGKVVPEESIALPWRAWAFSGGATIFVAYLVEYFPSHLGGWRLESVHPLYGLAWIGGGELLARTTAWIRREKPSVGWRGLFVIGLAVIAVAAVPVVMWTTASRGFLVPDLLWPRLNNLPGGVVATSFKAWLARDGATGAVWATLLPLVVVLPAGWLMLRRTTELGCRIALAVAFGPVLVALGFALRQLSWWSVLDGALLMLMVAATARREVADARPNRWLWPAVAGLFAIPGLMQLRPQQPAGAGMTLTAREAEELIERHLAHWLASHAGEEGAVVYAPPNQTTTLGFYGGLRGLGTFAADNRTGLGTTLLIAGANTMGEAQAQLQARGVRYIVVPSWDPFFDEFAQRYLVSSFSNRTSLLIRELRSWNLPPWLRPVSYPMPAIGGFEGQSVLVFELVDEQSPPLALGRLAEYLVEAEELDKAAATAEALRRFPGDVGALVARVQVQTARGDAAGAAQTLDIVLSRLSTGADRFLPWDRRVSLAVVLARANRVDPAREQTRRCLRELDEPKLRSLSPGALYGLLVLSHSFEIALPDAKLRELALNLLPADLRANL